VYHRLWTYLCFIAAYEKLTNFGANWQTIYVGLPAQMSGQQVTASEHLIDACFPTTTVALYVPCILSIHIIYIELKLDKVHISIMVMNKCCFFFKKKLDLSLLKIHRKFKRSFLKNAI
jgi:hypothetical protein